MKLMENFTDKNNLAEFENEVICKLNIFFTTKFHFSESKVDCKIDDKSHKKFNIPQSFFPIIFFF